MTAPIKRAARPKSSFLHALPTLRDGKYGWLNFVALSYALTADAGGLALLLCHTDDGSRSIVWSLGMVLAGILLSAHGRILASYLVHEAAHASIFVTPWANRWFGCVALWLAGCPYADFAHVKSMHLKHHLDRADTVEFDYRTAVNGGNPLFRRAVLAAEYCFVPVVETIMHVRTALYPVFWSHQVATSRRQSARLGTPVWMLFYAGLWHAAGIRLVCLQLLSGALVLQYLALNDAFHHTYEAMLMKDYTPGPGPRTAAYEEENTYSNLIRQVFQKKHQKLLSCSIPESMLTPRC